jgi:hypothetical protein
MARRIRSLLLTLLLVMTFCSSVFAGEKTDDEPDCLGTFSNMYFHQEAGDLLGEEIKIVIGEERTDDDAPLIGIFQQAMGAPLNPVLVDVRCGKDGVEFALPTTSMRGSYFRGTSRKRESTRVYPCMGAGTSRPPRRAS